MKGVVELVQRTIVDNSFVEKRMPIQLNKIKEEKQPDIIGSGIQKFHLAKIKDEFNEIIGKDEQT